MEYFLVSMNLEILYGAAVPELTWPGTLPQSFQRSGLGVTGKNAAVRSNNDSGPSYQRPRFTASMDTVKGNMVMTTTQLNDFNTFYETTLSKGSMRFTMPHPYTGVTQVMQYDTSQHPQVVPMLV